MMHLSGIKKIKTNSILSLNHKNLEKDKEILKEYVCEIPFMYTDIHENGQFLCCPSWSPLNTKIDEHGQPNRNDFDKTDNVMRNWTSISSKRIRMSVFDGSYKQCNHLVCPKLNQIINSKEVPTNFLPKKEFSEKYDIYTADDIKKYKVPPEEILFGFDRSCNLACPSCRLHLIANDRFGSTQYKNKLHLLKSIEDEFGCNLKRILVTGSGDPFYSNLYRKYLQEFDITKYPKLETIQIITNGNMLNKKMWDSLKSAPYIKYIEVSIDAGTKDTYENKTRLNGRWDTLISNLHFLSTIDTIENIVVSMVISKNNYKEMLTFWEVITDIFKNFKNSLGINYRQIVDWNTHSKEELKELQVFNEDHELYNDFLNELKKIHRRHYVNHNFHHLDMDEIDPPKIKPNYEPLL